MLETFLDSGLYVVVDASAFAVVVFCLYTGSWKRLGAPWVYLCSLLLLDGAARRYFLFHNGISSGEYAYCYWLTDVALALGAFLTVCTFFHRACGHDAKLWGFLRLFLVSVFLLVLGITLLSLSRNIDKLFTHFIINFQQNLYFTGLVLNTLLYVMMQQINSADDELHMLVCGMGLQFAGPAAAFALRALTPDHELTKSVMVFVGPLCTMGMLLTWFYAVVKMPKPAAARASGDLVPLLAKSSARLD